MLNITKTTKIVAFAFMLAFLIPTAVSAAKDNSGGFDWSGSGWDDYYGGSGSSYYYDTPSYDYSYDYTPDYSYDYSTPDYSSYGGSYDYGSYYPSYTSSYGGGSSYPSYTGSYGGSSYYTPSTPATSYSSSNPYTTSNSAAASNATVTSTNTNQNNSSATATGGNSTSVANGGNAVNNNVNNVYVYTNPTGNAVVNNPAYQRLDGYCIITPSNPRTGQTVTATAYMTGGVGEYSYTWGGDLNSSATGVSTSFTSYNAGTKNITVTARSGQDVKTVNCNVTFQNENYISGNNLSVVCYPSVQTVGINQLVTWRTTVTGGSGYYTYSWTGSDSLYGNNSTVTKSYTYGGQKYATVTATSNGQSTSATCYTNVNAISAGTSVSGVYVQPSYISPGRPVSGVYLNDLPATGITLTWIHYMIAIMVLVLGGVATYISKNKTRFTGVVDSE